MFLWRNLQPDALAVLLRYLAGRTGARRPAARTGRPAINAEPRTAPPADHRG